MVMPQIQLLNRPCPISENIWTFAVIGHPRSESECHINPRLKKALKICLNEKVDIIFLAGDNILGLNPFFRNYKKDLDTLVDYLETFETPIFVTPGNHDYNSLEQKKYFEERLNG